ncbi:hypothetical protein [Streptomyces subrutilus]|uniref:hypothetical protein n=1 Tax=Streptomyces subrutilus TaxID=36818 RepID=UPI002E0E99F9|nr:hypothetical protein OG479_01805 [Streptomyces subrutilus]
MSGVYEADPQALRRAVERMRRLPELAQGLGRNFISDERNYTPWPGWTDDFAGQVRPVYERNNEYCLNTGEVLYEALDGLVRATLANLSSIERTQSDSSERIADHRRRTPESVFDDQGTGGRH